MPKPPDPDLFDAAGLELEEGLLKSEETSGPKRPRKPKPPTPAERAAAVRLEGGRRSRAPSSLGQRSRIGTPRDLSPAPVLAFPLTHNASMLAEVIERLPHGYDEELETTCDREARNLEKRLIRRGISKQSARSCARDVLNQAYTNRVRDAHKESGLP